MIIRIDRRRITKTAWRAIDSMRKYFWEFEAMYGTSQNERQIPDYVCITFSSEKKYLFDAAQLSEIMEIFHPVDWELGMYCNKDQLTLMVDNTENIWAVGPNKIAFVHFGAYGMLNKDKKERKR